MKLFTKQIEQKLIDNFNNKVNDDDFNPEPVVKLFDPYGAATWLLTEYDPENSVAYGLCDLGMGFPELGYVSVDEIKALQFCGAPRIERDMYWDADGHKLSEFAEAARGSGSVQSYL